MLKRILCRVFGHKPRWRRINGLTAECCKRCGKIYRLGGWHTLDDY